MFTKQNLLATLAGFAVMFVLGYVIWGFAAADFFESHSLNEIMKDPPEMLLLAISNIIAVFALSTIYGKWARGIHNTGQGFKFGIWIGIFTGLGLGLLSQSTTELMDMTGQIVEAILEIVFYGIIGAVIALVYKATAPKTTTT
ncbi:hypothetical protein [uncultured Eudoraea sp.]|uniref:hypothetical protein n=1 Tax=uncultured Eudoraea sp. TaxID=1035614 RepID=UPI0026220069|nr:hypothetical protein [uncultured Eudoraea sp.]